MCDGEPTSVCQCVVRVCVCVCVCVCGWVIVGGWTENQVGDDGARALAEALQVNSTLTELHLYGE